jgi:hypothetical protein
VEWSTIHPSAPKQFAASGTNAPHHDTKAQVLPFIDISQDFEAGDRRHPQANTPVAG